MQAHAAEWEFWPFHVTCLTNVEHHCGQTWKAKTVFSSSIVLSKFLVVAVATVYHLNSSALFHYNYRESMAIIP